MNDQVPYCEKELLIQAANGSAQAFARIFEKYRRQLYTNIFKITESRECAEDAVHEVFLKLWKRRENLSQVENLSAYLNRMAQNHAYNGFRRLAKESLILNYLSEEQPSCDNNTDHLLMAKEVKEMIRQAVEKLTPQQKQVFRLSRDQGMKHEEIARHLNISVSTVKKHMVTALRFLKEELDWPHTSPIILYIIFMLGENY